MGALGQMEAKAEKVVVVGAGIVGLTVATMLRETLPEVPLTLWAKDFPPNTTSNIAGGLVCPYLCSPPHRVLSWTAATFRHYRQRYMGAKAWKGASLSSPQELVREQKCYEYFPHRLAADPYWKEIMPSYRRLNPDELPAEYADGFVVDALVVEVPQLLAQLVQGLRDDGVTFVRREVHDLCEAFHEFDLVINCTGIGSRWLCNDPHVYPLRGQIVRVRQVGCDRTVSDEEGPNSLGYFISRQNDIILGGTAIKDEWSTNVDERTTEEILRKVENLSAGKLQKKDLEVLEVLVGLRPARTEVRLEKEEFSHGAAKKTVIHNYGHGGSGFTVAWGCAEEVVSLVQSALSDASRRPHDTHAKSNL